MSKMRMSTGGVRETLGAAAALFAPMALLRIAATRALIHTSHLPPAIFSALTHLTPSTHAPCPTAGCVLALDSIIALLFGIVIIVSDLSKLFTVRGAATVVYTFGILARSAYYLYQNPGSPRNQIRGDALVTFFNWTLYTCAIIAFALVASAWWAAVNTSVGRAPKSASWWERQSRPVLLAYAVRDEPTRAQLTASNSQTPLPPLATRNARETTEEEQERRRGKR
jgi:hypothetical protein